MVRGGTTMPVINRPAIVSSQPADVAVVLETALQPSLARALDSVYRQDFVGRIHVLVGIECNRADPSLIAAMGVAPPEHVELTVMDLGYATAARFGGPYGGGALRTLLTFAARAIHVAYLEETAHFEIHHLSALRSALGRLSWAYGAWARNGVEPSPSENTPASAIMVDKLRCHAANFLWCREAPADGTQGLGLLLQVLRLNFPEHGVSRATSVHIG